MLNKKIKEKNVAAVGDGKLIELKINVSDFEKSTKKIVKRYKQNKLDRITITRNNFLCYLQNELNIDLGGSKWKKISLLQD